jgi:hypothetical protein
MNVSRIFGIKLQQHARGYMKLKVEGLSCPCTHNQMKLLHAGTLTRLNTAIIIICWNHSLQFRQDVYYSGLVVRVPGYRSRGPVLDSLHYRILLEVVGLERGPLSHVSTTEELFGRKSSGLGLENREYGDRNPLC